jgi:hypothetical protein
MPYGIGEFHIRDVGQIKPGNATTFGILNYLKNTRVYNKYAVFTNINNNTS